MAISRITCEICKSPIKRTANVGGHEVNIITIEKPQVPYLCLETVPNAFESNNIMYIISSTNRRTTQMGRGHQCDIRMQDISASRTHAAITFKDGAFFIEDSNSKFGTLVKSANPINLTEEK